MQSLSISSGCAVQVGINCAKTWLPGKPSCIWKQGSFFCMAYIILSELKLAKAKLAPESLCYLRLQGTQWSAQGQFSMAGTQLDIPNPAKTELTSNEKHSVAWRTEKGYQRELFSSILNSILSFSKLLWLASTSYKLPHSNKSSSKVHLVKAICETERIGSENSLIIDSSVCLQNIGTNVYSRAYKVGISMLFLEERGLLWWYMTLWLRLHKPVICTSWSTRNN